MITGPRRGHFAYSCFKLAYSVWIVQLVIGAASGPEDRKAAYNVIVAGLVEDIDKRNILIGLIRSEQMKRSGHLSAKAWESGALAGY